MNYLSAPQNLDLPLGCTEMKNGRSTPTSSQNPRFLISVSHVPMQGWLSPVVPVAMAVAPGISREKPHATASAARWTGPLLAAAI